MPSEFELSSDSKDSERSVNYVYRYNSDSIRISFLKGDYRDYGEIYVHNEEKNIFKMRRFSNEDQFYDYTSECISGIVPSDV